MAFGLGPVNPVGTARHIVKLSGWTCWNSACDRGNSRNSIASSTISARGLYSNLSPPKVKPGTCRLSRKGRENNCIVVRAEASSASAKAEEVETDNNANAEGEDSDEDKKTKLLRACTNILRNTADWKKAKAYKESGEIYEGKVDGANNGGVLVRFNSLQGFLPYSQMNIEREGSKSFAETAKDFIGSTLSVRIIEADEEEKKLIFSEMQAIWAKFVEQIKEGDVFDGRVTAVVDFGAFVDLLFPDGGYHIRGLLHKSEISWDLVQDPRDFLKEGENVRVKVTKIDKRKSRLSLSMKRLQADPLFETLDTVMPQDETTNMDTSGADLGAPNEPLPGLEKICEELCQEEGVIDVKIGRQALEKRVVSQDLELWLSNIPSEGGKFTLVARAGRQVQEVHLETSLEREGIKQALQRVRARVP